MNSVSDTNQIFIVGGSRSGTTILGRIFEKNAEIFTFRELHFFGTLWTSNSNKESTKKDQIEFLLRLFCIEENRLIKQENITENDAKSELRVDPSKINKWSKGGLSNGEIYLSQKFSSKMMDKFGYEKKEFAFPPLSLIFHLLSFPVKLGLAFLFNIHRMGNIVEVIKKRFFIK